MQERRHTALFVRLPDDQARLLDRAASVVSAHKKDLISGLVAQHVDPDTPQGIEALRAIAAAGGSRRIVVETQDSGIQRGFGYFNPTAPADDTTPCCHPDSCQAMASRSANDRL